MTLFSKSDVEAAITACCMDLFIDDNGLIGTSQQHERAKHYVRVAIAAVEAKWLAEGRLRIQAAYFFDQPYAMYDEKPGWRCSGNPWKEELRNYRNFPVHIIKDAQDEQ